MSTERPSLKPLIIKAKSMNAVEQVYFINEIFGNTFMTSSIKKIISQTENMYDEADEFVTQGLDADNHVEVIDAIGDLLTFGYGIGYMLGISNKTVSSYEYYERRENISNRDMIKLVVYQTDKLINLLKNEDINQSIIEYETLVGLVKSLCTLNDVNHEELMTRITISNLTKICSSFDECQSTIDKYVSMGVDVYAKYFKVQGFWIHVVYSSKEQVVNGKMYRADKFLKCVYFEEPVLNDLV